MSRSFRFRFPEVFARTQEGVQNWDGTPNIVRASASPSGNRSPTVHPWRFLRCIPGNPPWFKSLRQTCASVRPKWPKKPYPGASSTPSPSLLAITNEAQMFCKEAVTWKRLAHPNVLPLLGITITPLQLVSNWVSGGNLLGYIKEHPDADLLKLVGVPSSMIILCIILSSGVRHCQGPSLPPLSQCNTWGPQRST